MNQTKEYWILDQNLNKIAQLHGPDDKKIEKALDKMPRASLWLIHEDGGQQLIGPKTN